RTVESAVAPAVGGGQRGLHAAADPRGLTPGQRPSRRCFCSPNSASVRYPASRSSPSSRIPAAISATEVIGDCAAGSDGCWVGPGAAFGAALASPAADLASPPRFWLIA